MKCNYFYHKVKRTWVGQVILLYIFGNGFIACFAQPSINWRTLPQDTATVNYLLETSINVPNAEAFAMLEEAIIIAEQKGYPAGKAKALMYLGIEKEEEGINDEAQQHYRQAIELYEQLGDSLGVGKANANMGAVLFRSDALAKAIPYFERAEPLIRTFGNPNQLAIILNSLGAAYRVQKEYQKSLKALSESIQFAEELGDTLNLILALNNQGTVYQSMGDSEKSLSFFERSIALAVGSGYLAEYCRIVGNYAESLLSLKKNQEAYTILKENYAYCQTNPSIAYTVFLSQFAQAAAATGNYEEAYTNMRLAKILDDSTYTLDKQKVITELDKRYETAKKNHQIQQLENQQQRQRIIIFAVLVGLLLIAALAYSIFREKRRSDNLLGNILPKDTIEELKTKGSVAAREYKSVSVLFSDFQGFTELSEHLTPPEIVKIIDDCFRAFDQIIAKYPVEKIKTIGDSYMCASGLPLPNPDHAKQLIFAALEMQNFMKGYNQKRLDKGLPALPMRIGIHSGPVIAGVVGEKKFTYDIWGDTVNTAARMESSGAPDKINISPATYELVKDDFSFELRGKVAAKGKDEMEMYFVEPISIPV